MKYLIEFNDEKYYFPYNLGGLRQAQRFVEFVMQVPSYEIKIVEVN